MYFKRKPSLWGLHCIIYKHQDLKFKTSKNYSTLDFLYSITSHSFHSRVSQYYKQKSFSLVNTKGSEIKPGKINKFEESISDLNRITR